MTWIALLISIFLEFLMYDVNYNRIFSENVSVKLIPWWCFLHLDFGFLFKIHLLKEVNNISVSYLLQSFLNIRWYQSLVDFPWIKYLNCLPYTKQVPWVDFGDDKENGFKELLVQWELQQNLDTSKMELLWGPLTDNCILFITDLKFFEKIILYNIFCTSLGCLWQYVEDFLK